MALQCGIVGLPNVGKSTLFNCLSNAKAQSANFPFCTIEPNVGVITVPDERDDVFLSLIEVATDYEPARQTEGGGCVPQVKQITVTFTWITVT